MAETAKLFESDSDVRVYVAKVDGKIETLNRDLWNYILKKWGPNGLSATTNSPEELSQLKDDKTFYDAWKTFYGAWKTRKADIDSTSVLIKSADVYRDVETYDNDAKAWRGKFQERGVYLSSPEPATPASPILDAIGALGITLFKAGLIVGGGYLAFKYVNNKLDEQKATKTRALPQ